MPIYFITLTEWNSVGYDNVETYEHGRWHFTDDMEAMNLLLTTLIQTYNLKLSAPNTWEWGGEFKGLVLYLSQAKTFNGDTIKDVIPPTFTWLKDEQEWYK